MVGRYMMGAEQVGLCEDGGTDVSGTYSSRMHVSRVCMSRGFARGVHVSRCMQAGRMTVKAE